MLLITVEAGSVQHVTRALSAVERRVSDLRPAMERVGEAIYAHEREVFATEGAATAGGRWAPLSPRYAAWKARQAPGRTILQLTGAMMESLIRPGATHSIYRVTDDSIEVGTSDPKVIRHQQGTGRMPARRVIDPPPRVIEGLVQIVERHIEDGL